MGRETDGQISLTSGDLERSDKVICCKNRLSVRDSAIVTEVHPGIRFVKSLRTLSRWMIWPTYEGDQITLAYSS